MSIMEEHPRKRGRKTCNMSRPPVPEPPPSRQVRRKRARDAQGIARLKALLREREQHRRTRRIPKKRGAVS